MIDAGPEAGEWEAAVTGVGESYARCGHHAALAHAEGGDDGEAEAGEGGVAAKALQEECGPGLAEVGVEDVVDVDYYVGGYELEEPAEDAAYARGEDYGSGGGYVGVGAFLWSMTW